MTSSSQLSCEPARAGLCEPTPVGDKPFHLGNFIHQLKLDGYSKETIEPIYKSLRRLAKQCDITNPYEIKETLANLKWKNSTKKTVTSYCTKYLKFIGKTWDRPKYKTEQRFPFIPTEQEIDQLIASTHTHKHAVNLQILKETDIRTDELTKLKWTDINTEQKTVTVTPSKGSNPRILPISNKLIGMLNQLPKTKPTICTMQKHTIRTVFTALRNKTAKKLNNPRIKQITLHTFRHWKATTEYHKTHDIVHIKNFLGHKSIENTMIYINIENALFLTENNEYHSATAKTIQEAQKLIETGFQYVTTIKGMQLFKKRK